MSLLPLHEVRRGTPADLAFVLHLQKKHSNAVGFLPKAALNWYLEAGRVVLVEENDEPAGYVLGRIAMRYNPMIRPITQAAICFDAQRRHLGLAAVQEVEEQAFESGQRMLQCWCANDLEAQTFWPAAGFTAIGVRHPANKRLRPLTLWRKPIVSVPPRELFELPAVAGWKGGTIRALERARCLAPPIAP